MPSQQQSQHQPSRWVLIVGLCAAGLAIVSLAALEWSGTPETTTDVFEQITDSMPRKQVESILGAGTVVVSRVEHIGAVPAKVDVLEWRISDGQQRIRIEFVDDQVLTKTVSEH